MFVKLESRACLVVGAGKIAESKIEGLLRAGAKVRVVAPEATEKIQALASEKRVRWEQRSFDASDLGSTFLVVAATNSLELHEEVFRCARANGVLCNVPDDPLRCDFYYPAIVRRGPLQIAISTAGLSPALAQRLRHELENRYGQEYSRWVEHLGQVRQNLMARELPAEQRRQMLHEAASGAAFAYFKEQQAAARQGRR